jgi:hypothetical protein
MANVKADNPKDQQYFDYLEKLRQSGVTNMYGAATYLIASYGMTKERAIKILTDWMQAHTETRKLAPKEKS